MNLSFAFMVWPRATATIMCPTRARSIPCTATRGAPEAKSGARSISASRARRPSAAASARSAPQASA
ncbi:MAG: hypothetical protein IJH09_09920, partial [Clostridia bacterium]|nr:hypothetical protein [Clostridia bacterium]